MNGSVLCLCNKRLQNGLPFNRTLACDQLHGLLIASSNEKLCWFFFSVLDAFDIVSNNNQLIKLELRRTFSVDTDIDRCLLR